MRYCPSRFLGRSDGREALLPSWPRCERTKPRNKASAINPAISVNRSNLRLRTSERRRKGMDGEYLTVVHVLANGSCTLRLTHAATYTPRAAVYLSPPLPLARCRSFSSRPARFVRGSRRFRCCIGQLAGRTWLFDLGLAQFDRILSEGHRATGRFPFQFVRIVQKASRFGSQFRRFGEQIRRKRRGRRETACGPTPLPVQTRSGSQRTVGNGSASDNNVTRRHWRYGQK